LEIQEPFEIKPGQVRCPRCFSRDLALSKPRGLFDAIMERFKRVPRHCRGCGKRFYVVGKAATVQLE
jgi:hypothetical protein